MANKSSVTSTNKLVSYDSSSSDEIANNNYDDVYIPSKKRKLCKSNNVSETAKQKIPLPLSIVSMFEDQKHKDDSTKHSGRARTFPHEKGNWSSYVYLQLEEFELLQQSAKLIHQYLTNAIDMPQFNIIEADNLHISVSRTLPIPYHWIEPITQSLKKISEQIQQLYVTFDSLQVYPNDDNSRSFIGLRVCLGEQSLRGVVKQVDKILEEYALQKFYIHPSFHISLLWSLGTVDRDRMHASLLHIWNSDINHIVDNKYLLDALHFKSGYKNYNFLLSSV